MLVQSHPGTTLHSGEVCDLSVIFWLIVRESTFGNAICSYLRNKADCLPDVIEYP